MRSPSSAHRIARSLLLFAALFGLALPAARPLRAVEDVTLAWSPNAEADLAGYKVYYGMRSGQYDFAVEASLDTSFTFTELDSARYYFAVTALDTAGNESAYSEEITWKPRPEDPVGIGDEAPGGPGLPRSFALSQNYPNPFNPSTAIRYAIPASAGRNLVATTLRVYDTRGREVRTLVADARGPGEYTVQWDGADDRGVRLASGTYLYRLQAGAYSSTRKMVIDK